MTDDEEVLARVTKVFGKDPGRELFDHVLKELGVSSLHEPQDQLRFADRLIARAGLFEVVGRSLKVRALLRGASRQ